MFPESLKTGNAINKLCRRCVKAGSTFTMITARKDLSGTKKSEKSGKGA